MRSTKRGKVIIISLLALLLIVFISTIWLQKRVAPDVHYVYKIEDDFKGCIYTVYDQKGADTLVLADDKISITVDGTGYFKTSSSIFFGVNGKENPIFRKDFMKKNSKEMISKTEIEELGVFVAEKETKEFFYTVSRYKTKDSCILDVENL